MTETAAPAAVRVLFRSLDADDLGRHAEIDSAIARVLLGAGSS